MATTVYGCDHSGVLVFEGYYSNNSDTNMKEGVIIKMEKKELSETARSVLLAVAVIVDFALMITTLALYLFY